MEEIGFPELGLSELQPIPAPETVPVTKPHSIVTQSNKLINSHFDMSTVQLRAFIYAVGNIHKNDKELGIVKIPIKSLYHTEGGKNYRDTVKLATELENVKIKILSILKGANGDFKRHYESYTIFPTVKYTEDSKFIVTRINPDLKPFLLNLQGNYTQAELEKLFSIKTIQAYRIYMFIKMNLHRLKSEPDALKIDYKEFRLMLGLDILEESEHKKLPKLKPLESDLFGNPTNTVKVLPAKPKVKVLKYAEFDNFKKRILKTAQAELKKTGLLDFEFEVDKEGGRSVKYIIFKLRSSLGIDQPKIKLQPATPKYKPAKAPKQNLRATSKLNLFELQQIHKENYEEAIAARLRSGWYWNEDQTILYKD